MTAALPAWLLTAAGAAAYLLVEPGSADLAAQTYRVELFEREGLTIWNSGWYAGHHTPGYSTLYPPLGALLGVRVTGALAAVAAAAIFERLAHGHWDERARAGSLLFAGGVAVLLLSGRMTYVLGIAVALGALLALRSDRRALAVALAAASALASPVSGLFLALAAVAWGLAGHGRDRRPWAAAMAAAALVPTMLLAGLFGEGGDHEFVASAFWPTLAGGLVVAALLPARERALRAGALLYAAGCVLAFAIDTPLGGNVSRLGELMAGPLVVGALAGRMRTRTLVAVALPLAFWQVSAPVREAIRAEGDPSLQARYHAGVVDFLASRPQAGSFRVEVPFTRNHWEAVHVARHVPLARGWVRQLDRKYGALFYGDELDPRRYRAWIDEHAVRYVALPDVELDHAGRDEAALVRRGVAWLRPVWRDEHWRVYEVADPQPLMSGVPGHAHLDGEGFVLFASRPGTALVRVRHTRWWRVTGGEACVGEAAGGMTRVRVARAGVVRVRARLRGSRCTT